MVALELEGAHVEDQHIPLDVPGLPAEWPSLVTLAYKRGRRKKRMAHLT